MVTWDVNAPSNTEFIANGTYWMREKARQLKEDRIVDAGLLGGYSVGNGDGQIPRSNGTLNVNLNAQLLNGRAEAYFAVSTHGHLTANGTRDGFMAIADYNKLAGIAASAEVNQMAYSSAKVGATTMTSTSKTGTLEFIAQTGITLTANDTNKSISFKVADGGVGTTQLADLGVTSGKLAAGVAAANLGYTPVNKGGDTISFTGVGGLTGTPEIRFKTGSFAPVEVYMDGTAGANDNKAYYSLHRAGVAAWKIGMTGSSLAFSTNNTAAFDMPNTVATLSSAGILAASRFTSTVAVGTAPLTVTSTTMVTNLNADMLDGNHASAFALLTGASFSGTVYMASGLNITGGNIYMPYAYAGIEMGSLSVASTPFIDFHSSTFGVDYDVRIIASGGSAVQGNGRLDMYAAGGVFANNTRVHTDASVKLLSGKRQTVLAGSTNSDGTPTALRGATFGVNLIPMLTTNTSAAGYVASASSLYNASYDAWHAFDKYATGSNEWLSVTGTVTGWLQIDLPSGQVVQKYAIRAVGVNGDIPFPYNCMPKDWTFEGWNGSAWVVLDTRKEVVDWRALMVKEFAFVNATAYTKYRVNVTANNGYASYTGIGELMLYNTVAYKQNVLPYMMGDYHMKGIRVERSSAYDETNYAAWRMFDGEYFTNVAGTDSWHSASGLPQWFTFELSEPKKITRIVMYPRNEPTIAYSEAYFPKNFTFDAWNGTAWVTLYTGTNVPSTKRGEGREFTFANATAYRKYRLHVTAAFASATTTAINNFEAHESDAAGVVPVNQLVLDGTETPLVFTAACGFDDSGAVDFVGRITTRQAVTNLIYGCTNYVYAEYTSATGAWTYGTSSYPPHYGDSDPLDFMDRPANLSHESAYQYFQHTDDFAPERGGHAYASSYYNASYLPYMAFDGYDTLAGITEGSFVGGWMTSNGTRVGWLAYCFSFPRTIYRYAITCSTNINPLAHPKDWTFEGFNEATNTWVVLDTRTNVTGWAAGQRKDFTCTTTGAYRKYRINITANNASVENYTCIGGFHMFDNYVGQHWFDTSEMVMKVWNGNSWDVRARVFIGEAYVDGNGGVPSGAMTYAYNGVYDSGWFATATGQGFVKPHNLGFKPRYTRTYYKNFLYDEFEDEIGQHPAESLGGQGANVTVLRNNLIVNIGSYRTNNWRFDSSGKGGSLWAQGFYRVYAERGW